MYSTIARKEIRNDRMQSAWIERRMPQAALNLSSDLQSAVEAALIAGEELRCLMREPAQMQAKSQGDWLSSIDQALDSTLRTLLRRANPDYSLLTEEAPPEERGQKTWVVDPLDGTSALLFSTSPDQPSIMLSLVDCTQIVSAVVYFPLTGELFFAERGKGAFKEDRRLDVRGDRLELARAQVMLNHYGDSSYETMAFADLRHKLRKPGAAGLVTVEAPHSGAACRVVEAARPIAALLHDNAPQNPKQMPWDIAAPKLIVEEAGGIFWNLGGKPYEFSHVGPILVARSAALGEQILQLTRSGADVDLGKESMRFK